MISRRHLVAAVGASVLAKAISGAFGQARKARVGWLGFGALTAPPYITESLRRTMQCLGYVEARNDEYLIVAADGHAQRLGLLARELVEKKGGVSFWLGHKQAQLRDAF